MRELGDGIFELPNRPDDDLFTPITQSNIRSPKISDSIVESIEYLISDRLIEVGEQLPPEETLASNFQVSRTVAREAIVKLEARGLPQVKRGGGIYVSDSQVPTITDPLLHLLSEHSEAMFDFLELPRALEELTAY